MAYSSVSMAAGREVMDVFPLLIPQDNSKRFYQGFITVCVSSGTTVAYFTLARFYRNCVIQQNQSFGFSLRIPETGVLKDARSVPLLFSRSQNFLLCTQYSNLH